MANAADLLRRILKSITSPSRHQIITLLTLLLTLVLIELLYTNHDAAANYIVTNLSSPGREQNAPHPPNPPPPPPPPPPREPDWQEKEEGKKDEGGKKKTGEEVQQYADIRDATGNETLGFDRIYYISLPHRSDRQDAMTLLSKTSNMSLIYEPAILGKNIDAKAKPFKTDGQGLNDAGWGCWRSHVNLWRKMVKENIETMLIIEDDLDWDVNLKDVMYRLSTQMRTGGLRNSKMSEWEEKNAPYGTDWDTLHLGTCYDFAPNPLPRHIRYNDPHSPGTDQLDAVYTTQLRDVWHEKMTPQMTVRYLYPAWNPVCTIGYALTQRGAQRLLYNVGILPIGDPIDVAMLVAEKSGAVHGYTVMPPVLTSWKSASARDSDIDDVEAMKGKGLFMEGSKNLRNSARKAMGVRYKNGQDRIVDLSEEQLHPPPPPPPPVKSDAGKKKEEEEKLKKAEEWRKKKEDELKKKEGGDGKGKDDAKGKGKWFWDSWKGGKGS